MHLGFFFFWRQMAKRRALPWGGTSWPLFATRMGNKVATLCIEIWNRSDGVHLRVVGDSVFLFAAQLSLLHGGTEAPEERLIWNLFLMTALNLPRHFRIELAFNNLTFIIRSRKSHLIWIQQQRNASKSQSARKEWGKRKVKKQPKDITRQMLVAEVAWWRALQWHRGNGTFVIYNRSRARKRRDSCNGLKEPLTLTRPKKHHVRTNLACWTGPVTHGKAESSHPYLHCVDEEFLWEEKQRS